MGMNFSPMYQPVSTKTIKADGDLNINPYDLLATDVKCDTVEASEFVGGVGNFSSTIGNTFKYTGLLTTDDNGLPSIGAIPSITTGPIFGNNLQNSVVNLPDTPSYPSMSGLFDITQASFDGDFYLRFSCTITSSDSYTAVMGIYKNGVRETTVSFGKGVGSKTVSIKVPYGDKSVWGYKWESGNLLPANNYSLTLNTLTLYPVPA